MSYINKKNGAS